MTATSRVGPNSWDQLEQAVRRCGAEQRPQWARHDDAGDKSVVEDAGAVDPDREARRVGVAVAVGHLHDEIQLLIRRRGALRRPDPADVPLAGQALDQHLVVWRGGLPTD